MSLKMIKTAFFATLAIGLLAGCSGGRGPMMFAGFNGDPHCAPGPKPCPRDMYPEFPLPPGGPYLETPPHGAPRYEGPAPVGPGPNRLDLSDQGKLTIAK